MKTGENTGEEAGGPILIPSLGAVKLAGDVWSRRYAAVREGARSTSSRVSSIQNRFLAIARLKYEFESLVDSQDEKESATVFYALDPHLISTYCDYGDLGKYQGFEFIDGEWGESDASPPSRSTDRTRYMLQLYAAIARHGSLDESPRKSRRIILKAGKQGLIKHVHFFTQVMMERSRSTSDELSHLIRDLSEIATLLETNPEYDEASAKETLAGLAEKFIASRSVGDLTELMALLRLRRYLRINPFHSIISALNSSDSLTDAEKQRFSEEYRKINEDNFLNSKLTTRMDGAWSDFRRLTDQDSQEKSASADRDATAERRRKNFHDINSEFLNRQAAVEIHLANYAFAKAGVNAQVRYLTCSLKLFSFLSPLRAHYSVPLVHPRFFFAYENEEIVGKFTSSLEEVLGAASTAVTRIESDGRITEDELRTFQKYKTHLNVLRDANVFASVGGPGELMSDLRSDLRDTVTLLTAKVKKVGEAENGFQCELRDLASRFEKLAHEDFGAELPDGDRLNDLLVTALDQEEGAFGILQSIQTVPGAEDERLVLVKKIVDQNGLIKRLVLLPIAGAYRYMFTITNSDVLNHESVASWFKPQRLKTIVTLSRLTTAIGAIAKECERGDSWKKNEALKFFMRAVYAGSYRDWTYSDSLAEQAISSISTDVSQLPPTDGAHQRLAVHNLRHELYYLRHMCKRGLAEQRYRLTTQIRYLNDAGEFLRLSAVELHEAYVEGLSSQLGRPSIYGSATPRLTMAYAGLLIELLVLQNQWAADFDSSELRLPDTNPFSDLSASQFGSSLYAWEHAVGTRPISFELAWRDPAKCVELLLSGLYALYLSIDAVCDLSPAEYDNNLDLYLWRFRRMRCLHLIFVLRSMANKGQIAIGRLPPLPEEYLAHRFREALQWHVSDSEGLLDELNVISDDSSAHSEESFELGAVPLPYAAVIAAELSFDLEASNIGAVDSADLQIGRKYLAFRQVAGAATKLDPLGMPRKHAELIKKKLAAQLVPDLESITAELRQLSSSDWGE